MLKTLLDTLGEAVQDAEEGGLVYRPRLLEAVYN
jgi:hypothetical protein